LAGHLTPVQGTVNIQGNLLEKLTAKQKAKALALLPQHPQLYSEMTVSELVALGRFPHHGLIKRWTAIDQQAVDEALAQTGLSEFEHKNLASLSGGQQQRAWIALVLAQDADVILLDEPINHLDLSYQIEILDLLVNLKLAGKSILLVLHDINLASRYADTIVALKNGQIYQQGTPEQVIDKSMIKAVFNQQAQVIRDPLYLTPMVLTISQSLPIKQHKEQSLC